MTPCGARQETPPPSWKMRRKPRCDRLAGHDGLHQEHDPRTFNLRAEWTP